MPYYRLIADGVVLIHAAYVAFVVVGFALIVAGVIAGWEWVRSFWFRAAHLAAIALVCAEALAGVECPLTTLESWLRTQAGQTGYSRDFVGYWIDRLIFYHFPQWVFVDAYLIFVMLVLIVFVAAPPRWPGEQSSIVDEEMPPRHLPMR